MLPVYKRSWILGEDKYVDLEVRSAQPGAVVIPKAEWVLRRNGVTEAEQMGACAVDGAFVSTLVEPQQTGTYTLEITYEVPPETRKVRVILDVR